MIQRQELDEKEKEESVQAKAADGGLAETHGDATQNLESRLRDSAGGTELPQQTLIQMNSALGADFSSVRLHTDHDALQMNQALNARAFTHGRDVYLGQSAFDPQSRSDNHLLAHELTHVVQQGAAASDGHIQRMSNTPDLQMLQVSNPATAHGNVQHRSEINSNGYIDWSAFIDDDVLLFQFQYLGSDNASVRLSLFDADANGYLGGDIVSWAPGDPDTQYIEFSEFPSRPGGGVPTTVITRAELINNTDKNRGIHAWETIYRGR